MHEGVTKAGVRIKRVGMAFVDELSIAWDLIFLRLLLIPANLASQLGLKRKECNPFKHHHSLTEHSPRQ